ncbi:hypothetical protein I6A60_11130 [Frankia sp. AgB1.9]|uniref:hypothetical protein n=1 Tax=unclassified Frankia TaxID=2632575 RepID=UPI00193250B7|nr:MULTISPECIES: hypothetical protein [unclassified Frankia]MBL7492013.1 hypothetical protein [Frankia sp. AgW1.1]MBL7548422.1 hypothetical protein [Frankia sp. AgB1.9]MBL7623457.1 hypothetical protein [Frankia sp. AgB1.8]
MVGLRSRRQDRTLLIVLWLFTAVVLVIGGLAVSGILLVWGTVGLLAAIFLTYIHVRDTRGQGDDLEAPATPGQDEDPAAPHDTDTDTRTDAEESR